PAVKLALKGPASATYPVTVTLSAPEPRLYFDMPCDVGTKGPRKTVRLAQADEAPGCYLAIFPDRDGANEQYSLTLDWADAAGHRGSLAVPVRVIDRDRNQAPTF